MKAIVIRALGGPEVLGVEERPIPEPGAYQVLIRVAAASVNFADIKARQGRYHGAGQPPFIAGLDAVGIVERVGSHVTALSPGMRVAAFPSDGSYAEFVLADEKLAYPLPDAMSWETAAALPTVGLTAYTLLHDVAQLRPGETVLVHSAAGGVGTTAVQLARLLGAGPVFGTVGSSAKVSLVQGLGAQGVVDYTREPFSQRVNDWTEGRGVDVILDSVGGTVSEESLACLAPFGRLVHFGQSSGSGGRITVSDLHASCRAVLGYSLGTVRRTRPESLRPAAETVMRLAAAGRLMMQVGRRYPLLQAAEAHIWMESRQSTGKIVLMVDGTV